MVNVVNAVPATATLLAIGPPEVYEYRIERDAPGRPARNAHGEVRMAFGAEDHSDPEDWEDVSSL